MHVKQNAVDAVLNELIQRILGIIKMNVIEKTVYLCALVKYCGWNLKQTKGRDTL